MVSSGKTSFAELNRPGAASVPILSLERAQQHNTELILKTE